MPATFLMILLGFLSITFIYVEATQGWNRIIHRFVNPLWMSVTLLVVLTTISQLLVGCSSPTSSSSAPEWLVAEWQIAQRILSSPEWVGSRAYTISPDQFTIEAMPGIFTCGDQSRANGCYSTDRKIQYNSETPSAIRHEAGHAILHVLGDSRWRCYEHREDCVDLD